MEILLYVIVIILTVIGCGCIGYELGVEDTERAYENKECDKCRNYKTQNCPNTSKCHELQGKPFFRI